MIGYEAMWVLGVTLLGFPKRIRIFDTDPAGFIMGGTLMRSLIHKEGLRKVVSGAEAAPPELPLPLPLLAMTG